MTTKEIIDDAEVILPELIKAAAIVGKWAATTGEQKMQSILDFFLGGLKDVQIMSKGGQKTSADVIVPAIESMAQDAYNGLKADGTLDKIEAALFPSAIEKMTTGSN